MRTFAARELASRAEDGIPAEVKPPADTGRPAAASSRAPQAPRVEEHSAAEAHPRAAPDSALEAGMGVNAFAAMAAPHVVWPRAEEEMLVESEPPSGANADLEL